MKSRQIEIYLNRPEYFFRPLSIYNRIFGDNPNTDVEFKFVDLPWGMKIRIPTNSHDFIKSISTYGVYDLSLTEVLWRLISPGEIAIDAGANIGYMTSIMSKRVGELGKVWCFEPNPEVYDELIENLHLWPDNINARKIALSNNSGTCFLNISSENRGQAFIDERITDSNSNELCEINMERLDSILKSAQIGVMKIDVEGHELEVLQGAGDLISRQNIRDIVFEEHRGYPSPVTNLLEENNYTVFQLWKGFWKPLLLSPSDNLAHPWEPPNYLATKDPDRATNLLASRGWQSLHGK